MALLRRAPELLVCLAAAATCGAAQNPTPAPTQQPPATCPQPGDPKAPCPAAPAPSAAQSFPYPGDNPSADDPLASAPKSDSTQPAAPSPSGGPDKDGKFPYPGDPDPAASSSSSSSSSSSASDDLPPDTPIPDHPIRRKLPKPTHLQSDDEREAEDIKVAKFYHDDGNYLGCYNRLKDAVSLIKDDPDAWYLLAQTTAKLGKTDESQAAWKTFLNLEPDTRRARDARRALSSDQARK